MVIKFIGGDIINIDFSDFTREMDFEATIGVCHVIKAKVRINSNNTRDFIKTIGKNYSIKPDTDGFYIMSGTVTYFVKLNKHFIKSRLDVVWVRNNFLQSKLLFSMFFANKFERELLLYHFKQKPDKFANDIIGFILDTEHKNKSIIIDKITDEYKDKKICGNCKSFVGIYGDGTGICTKSKVPTFCSPDEPACEDFDSIYCPICNRRMKRDYLVSECSGIRYYRYVCTRCNVQSDKIYPVHGWFSKEFKYENVREWILGE